MSLSFDYDKHDEQDVLRHAKALEKHKIGDVFCLLEKQQGGREKLLKKYAEQLIPEFIDKQEAKKKVNKGSIGVFIQEVYFGLPQDNRPQADLDEIGVEIKVSPLIRKPKAGLTVKERLVWGMINREKLPKEFTDSHIYDKCQLIMLVYYIDETNKGKYPLDFPFFKAAYIKIPDVDMAIIKQDYEYIRDCVNQNRYHDLHERDTNYLSPCRKGNGRAYSLKQKYMNQLFKEYISQNIVLYDPTTDKQTFDIIKKKESIVIDSEELKRNSFEEIVLRKFELYIGKTITEIRKKLMDSDDYKEWLSKPTSDKALFARTTFAMLGIKSEQAEEFVKSNTYVKTLRVNENLTMNEDISFSAFEFSDLMSETWKKSTVYEEMVNRRFLWSVFKYDGKDFVFCGARFWKMPEQDERKVHKGWNDIRDIVKNGVKFALDQKADGTEIKTKRNKNRVLNSFPDAYNTTPGRKEYNLCRSSKKLNEIISIRPHARSVYYDLKSIGYTDTDNSRCYGSKLPNGDIMTKQCFWFNNEYILKQIKDMFEDETK